MNGPVGVMTVVQDISIGAGTFGFDYQAGQNGHSAIKGSPAATFLCCLQGRWKVGAEGWQQPPMFFSVPHRNVEPLFSPSFRKFLTTVHITALQR